MYNKNSKFINLKNNFYILAYNRAKIDKQCDTVQNWNKFTIFIIHIFELSWLMKTKYILYFHKFLPKLRFE